MHVAAHEPPASVPAPVLPGLPLLGLLPRFQKDPLQVMREATGVAPVVRLPLPLVDAYAFTTPRLAEHVLVTNSKNYVKQSRGYQMLRLVLGNGLVTSEGSFWKRQRRLAQPAFHRERLAGFGEVMVQAAQDMVASWPAGGEVDLAHAYMHCTLRIIGQTMLSTDVTRDAEQVGAALTVALEHLIRRTNSLTALPEWVPTPGNRAFARALGTLDATVDGIIARRRREGPRPDLLSMLMDMVDPETGETMDDRQLRDEVMTIFLAGHETTANLLSWTSVLLGQAPAVMARLQAEVDQVLEGRPPTMADLPRLTLGAMVLKESLRLYPPVWMLGRLVVEDEVVEGTVVPKGALVFVSPWALHRDAASWPRPEAFEPDRWATETGTGARGTWMPFSLGQRKCIGDAFAMTEAQLILATVVQRARLTLVPGQTFTPEPVITLRPKGGVRAVVHPR